MNKTEQTTSPIFYDPTPANAGHCWEFHAAPEWEKQCSHFSVFTHAEIRDISIHHLIDILTDDEFAEAMKRYERAINDMEQRWGFLTLYNGCPS